MIPSRAIKARFSDICHTGQELMFFYNDFGGGREFVGDAAPGHFAGKQRNDEIDNREDLRRWREQRIPPCDFADARHLMFHRVIGRFLEQPAVEYRHVHRAQENPVNQTECPGKKS